jgi:predicted NUDIX family phosphoesterase
VAAANVIPDEQVLCVPTRALYSEVGRWRGLTEPTSEIWRAIARNSLFKPRAQLEYDPSYKQLVSYTLFISGRRIFVMQRLEAQGEERLRGLLSVGVGGHMNPVQDIPWPGRRRIADLKNLVTVNTIREIKEEVILAGAPPLRIVGFLNDDDNEVGKVHLGVVSVVRLTSPLLAVRETDKMLGRWAELLELGQLGTGTLTFETWSSLVLQGLV